MDAILRNPGFILATSLAFALPASAAVSAWNSTSNGSWNVGANWTPTGVPGNSSDVELGSVAGTQGVVTTLEANGSAASLTMTNGNHLDTRSHLLRMAGLASISNAGTTLLLGRNNFGLNDSLVAGSMDIRSDGAVKLFGGRLEIDGGSGDGRLDITGGGTLSGYGTVLLTGTGPGIRIHMDDGTISAGHLGGGILFGDTAGTLRINAANDEATLDLDQGISSTIAVRAAGTLDVNVALNDPYGSIISMSRKSTLDMEKAWSFNGTLNLATGAGSQPGQTKGPATITGATMTMEGGTINLDDADDHLIIDAALNGTGGIIHHDAGTLQFDEGSSFGNSVQWTVGSAAKLIVNDILVIANQNWDWDGDGGSDNIIEINDNGDLRADLGGPFSDDGWTGTMRIDGGKLAITGADNTWSVDGNLTVGGDTPSTINGSEMTLAAGQFTVEAGASLEMLAANAWDGGTLSVDGVADLEGDTIWAGATVNGAGTISQNSPATVTDDTTIGVDTYDMDGDLGTNALTTVNPGKTLAIRSARVELGTGYFDGTLRLVGGGLDVQPDWRAGSAALISLVNSGGRGAKLSGAGQLVMEAAGAKILVTGEDNVIDADVFLKEGTGIVISENGGEVDLGDLNTGADTITLDGGDISQDDGVVDGVVHNKSILTVTGDSEIKVTTFDWDQGTTIVGSAGSLNIDVDSIDDVLPRNRFDQATINLQGGSLKVNVSGSLWVMDARTHLRNGSSILGDTMQIGADNGGAKGELNVIAPGTANIYAPVVFASDAVVTINENAVLRTQTTTFEPVNGADTASFSGAGTWYLAGHNHINEPTTIHMEGGTIDFDNSAGGSVIPRDTDIDANLTVYAKSFEDYGNISFGPSGAIYNRMNIAEGRTLNVRLDSPADFWTVNNPGILNYNGGDPVSTFLAGADVHMDGTLNVAGQGRSSARMVVSGTVNILDASGWFVLGGGNDSGASNILAGGTVNGPGILKTDEDTVLSGHGTINADLAFPGNGRLYADNGTLRVAGDILDADIVGTADNDGVLELLNGADLQSSDTEIGMRGGELKGGAVTVGSRCEISGDGLVSCKIVNNGSISNMHAGETLVLENPANDNLWDGSSKTGSLIAWNRATLELRDDAPYAFSGTIHAKTGGTVFLNGFRMTLGSFSHLNLEGGALKYSGGPPMEIGGAVHVTAASRNARLETGGHPGGFLFKSGCDVALDGILELAVETTEIQNGAAFSGNGTLLNQPGSTLTLRDGASLTGSLQNSGDLVIGSSPGTASGENFTQLADGTLHIEIAGTANGEYDRLDISGDANLAGTLEISLLDGFEPSLGQTFLILPGGALTGTLSGAFDTVVQPPAMPAGLKFDVGYTPHTVRLTVVSTGDAYQEWIDSFASLVNPGDKLKSADPDGDGLDNLAEFALDGDPTTPAASGKIAGKPATVAGNDSLTFTFPVRAGAVHAADDPAGGELVLVQSAEGLRYAVQGSPDLETFPLDIAEVTGADAAAIQAGLPPLGDGWTYRTFRCPGTLPGSTAEFMRVRISE